MKLSKKTTLKGFETKAVKNVYAIKGGTFGGKIRRIRIRP